MPFLLNSIPSNAFVSEHNLHLGFSSPPLFLLCGAEFSGSPVAVNFFPMGEARRVGSLEGLKEPL